MKSLVVVMAHAKARDIYERHLRFWEAHESPILVIANGHGQVQAKYPEIGFGPENYRCYERWQRMLLECAEAAKGGTKMFMFYEYDSICLEPVIPDTRGLFGITQYLRGARDPTAIRYANFPYRVDAMSLVAMVEKMKAYPDFQEDGTNDRLIPGLAQLCGIPLIIHKPDCYGAPGCVITREMHPNVERAVMNGATMFHGVKTKEALDFILKCREEYKRKNQ